MRVYVSVILSLFIPALAWATPPVVGEKVTYTGTALRNDGQYEITRTTEVLEFDRKTFEYTVKNTFEQSAEGASMGGFDQTGKVSALQYLTIEFKMVPQLAQDCGFVVNEDKPAERIVTTPEVISTGLGLLETCRVEAAVDKNGTQATIWWSPKTAPWPARTREINLNGPIVMESTIQSITRPPAAPAQPGTQMVPMRAKF